MDGSDSLNIAQFNEIFGDSDEDFTEEIRLKLQEKIRTMNPLAFPISSLNRCICWRFLFGLISSKSKKHWGLELSILTDKYNQFKSDILPSISKAGSDPLSDNNPETFMYFENIEKKTAIDLDLNRLYMNGIDEEYFRTKRRNNFLLNVLFIWSVQRPRTSYRQGMHEICGTILYCLEKELEAWTDYNVTSKDKHFLSDSFSESNIEAHTYWLFTSIMSEIELLYDPTLMPVDSEERKDDKHGDKQDPKQDNEQDNEEDDESTSESNKQNDNGVNMYSNSDRYSARNSQNSNKGGYKRDGEHRGKEDDKKDKGLCVPRVVPYLTEMQGGKPFMGDVIRIRTRISDRIRVLFAEIRATKLTYNYNLIPADRYLILLDPELSDHFIECKIHPQVRVRVSVIHIPSLL
jgi:hypothetical protein